MSDTILALIGGFTTALLFYTLWILAPEITYPWEEEEKE